MIYNKHNIGIFLLITIVFIVSANIAWLNPRPDFSVYKTFEYIPLFWQYNVDSSMELLSGAFFPEYFEINNIRLSRPGYPILIKLFSLVINFIAELIYPISKLMSAGVAFLIIKFLIYLSSAKLLFEIIKNYTNSNYAIISVILIYFHYHSIFYATTFHTSELAFIIPIFVTFMFLNLKRNYSTYKNIFFSFIVGYLILCRPDYAIYISFILLGFLKKEYLKIFISIISHIIPMIMYLMYLLIIDLKFHHYGINEGGYLSWISEEVNNGYLTEYIFILINSFGKYLLNLFTYFSIFFIFFIFGLYLLNNNKKNNFNKFIIIYFILVWFQTFITNRWGGYMVADLSILIYPLSLIGLKKMFDFFFNIKKNIFSIKLLLIIYCLGMIISFINLPWIHPFKQKYQDFKINEFQSYEIN